MQCIKTGFHAYLRPHGLYLYGDAFALDQGVVKSTRTYVFRICAAEREPALGAKHFEILDYEQWFDQGVTSMTHNSTMICSDEQVEDLGYEGVPT